MPAQKKNGRFKKSRKKNRGTNERTTRNWSEMEKKEEDRTYTYTLFEEGGGQSKTLRSGKVSKISGTKFNIHTHTSSTKIMALLSGLLGSKRTITLSPHKH